MKKIVVTGHSKGIGQAIYNYFAQDATNTVVGFSRSNGFDITDAGTRSRIVAASADADVFVNNAYNFCDDSQTFMLQELYAAWTGQDRIIINLSTISTINRNQTQYTITKRKLDNFCTQQTYNLPHIINLKPCWIMVDRVKQEIGNSSYMTTEQLVQVLDFCINSPVKISSIIFKS